MRDEDISVRIVRLRRALGGAQVRHARRHSRSSAIWFGYKGYFNTPIRINTRFTIYEEWDGRKRRWYYEAAYQLELEASILMNWLTVLLNQATRQRGPPLGRNA